MKSSRLLAVGVVVAVTAFLVTPQAAQIVPTRGTRLLIAQTSDAPSSDQRALIATVQRMIDRGDLRMVDRRIDRLVDGRVHERYQQVFGGVPVFGADVAVQRRSGQVISMFGIVHDGLAVDLAARRPTSDIANLVRANGFAAITSGEPPVFILPTADGSVSVVYMLRDDTGKAAYVDANSGQVLLQIDEFQKQAAVGQGNGVFGDSKKISTTSQSGTFVAADGLRPPALETYDLGGDGSRALTLAIGRGSLTAADLARSPTNVWTDPAVVDGHVYAGWVYDYYFKRFQRQGLDDNNVRIQTIVNPLRAADFATTPASLRALFVNAFYSSACRCVVYGPGLNPGTSPSFPTGVRNFAGALDVVAHELTHAVTDASSRLAYMNESGALNEAFSDIMGTSVEFFFQPAGTGPRTADYLLGEDLTTTTGPLQRSMSNPEEFGQPDYYAFRSYIGAVRDFDSGGVHVNSGIANNAFYLAVEGGIHASGQRVTGVGAQNREQIEKVFYRAFTAMLPGSATFFQARQATTQAARDLYGVNSAPERAVAAAWDAVGVISPGAALTTTFTPLTVPASTATCGGVTPSFTFRVAVSEFQSVGFTVSDFEVFSYDANQRLISTARFTDTTFRTWFNECQPGSTRIGPGSTACATLCGSLGGRSSGFAIFFFTGVDDNGNFGAFNSDVLLLGTPLGTDANEQTFGAASYTKAVQQ
jgi:bacillolysin